jgi:iron(III) transport system permease protein
LDIQLEHLSRSLYPRFHYYQWIFSSDESLQALLNTILIGLGGATITIGLGCPLALLFLRASPGLRKGIDYLTFLPFVLPVSILGLALLLVFDQSALYGTVWFLLLGFCFKVLPFSIRNVQGVLLQIDHDLEAASMLAGASWLTTVRRISLPLASPRLLASWLLLFTVFIRQFFLPLLLANSDTQVLSNLVFREWAAGDIGHVAVYGVLVVFISLPLTVIARWLNR